jgi:hypothetical protein
MGKRLSLAVVVIALASYPLIAPKVGLAWPYPLRLPDQTHFHGDWYDRGVDCVAEPPGGGKWMAIGQMWTAFGPVGRPTLYTSRAAAKATSPYDIAVKDGGCYRIYRLRRAPGP